MDTQSNNEVTRSHQNYELLIRLDEQMKGLSRDFRDMSKGLDGRILILENTRLNKEEAQKMMSEVEKVQLDHEKRLRSVEIATEQTLTKIKTWGGALAIGFTILQIAIAVYKS